MRTDRVVHKPAVPKEPGTRAIVVDARGQAWQRSVNGIWMPATTPGDYVSRSWVDLVMHHGPLVVLYESAASS